MRADPAGPLTRTRATSSYGWTTAFVSGVSSQPAAVRSFFSSACRCAIWSMVGRRRRRLLGDFRRLFAASGVLFPVSNAVETERGEISFHQPTTVAVSSVHASGWSVAPTALTMQRILLPMSAAVSVYVPLTCPTIG